MEAARSPQPSVVPDGELAIPWSLSAFQKVAKEHLQGNFCSLPPIQTLTFRPRGLDIKNRGRVTQPEGAMTKMLHVGNIRRHQVFAFIDLDKSQNLHIRYAYQHFEDSKLFRIRQQSLNSVDFEEPFYDYSNAKSSDRATIARLKAIILYYFLAGKHLQQIVLYKTFWLDFKNACASVTGRSAHSKSILPTKQPTPASEQNRTATPGIPSSASRGPEGSQYDSTMSQKQKQEDEDDNESTVQTSTHGPRSHCLHGSLEQPLSLKRATSLASSPAQTPNNSRPESSSLHLKKDNRRLQNALQAKKLESIQLVEKIKNLTNKNIQLNMRCNAATAVGKQFKAQRHQLAAEIKRIRSFCDYNANAYKSLEQKHNTIQSQLVTMTSRATTAENSAYRLQEEVASLKGRENQTKAEATAAKSRKATAKAALHRLRAAIAKDMATLKGQAAAIAKSSTSLTNHAVDMATKYSINLTQEQT
ncbi:uncharacterized protein K460DRAFT_356193 [Cucurbitaria berberidis CBS 394.84]|uniref:Uncharacterized protein n=1 Tax=Cucurbitaria berberidis CBS 394.84 TaxID=1168544 RepID=A0A9P4L8W2_9PLEO|nr:uncharacterized protein K460DRAFT_356193 [Cucurbitaria berberidis CBS 394.84]KAF1846531.1 hypothetical protein K460DRAFT_356193 [Cucurbitaria berberidis CBS 394.84]